MLARTCVIRSRKSATANPQGELFKTELRCLIDERHALVKLAAEVDDHGSWPIRA
ncbi:MAG: hypothetical protein KF813_04695 [Trueperaceae bacterium]|nr:hypothetical protein [Trueperaceae bacterium]